MTIKLKIKLDTMMKKTVLLMTAMLLGVMGMEAQVQRNVEKLTLDAADLTASTQRRMDADGKACALVKLQTTAAIEKVEGNVVGDIVDRGSEKWVYVQSGTDQLVVYPQGEKPVTVSFTAGGAGTAKSLLTYQVVLGIGMGQGGAKFEEAQELFRSGNQGQAVECLKEAVAANYLPAYAVLGNCYLHGVGIGADPNQAFQYYKKGAEQGDADAQLMLADMYYNGKAVKQDFKQAAYWFEKSAEQGNAEAQHAVGDMYLNGRGVGKDTQKGVEFVRKAANQGLPDACMGLGILYQMGIGVQKDVDTAILWIEKAASQDNAQAMSMLSTLYMVEKGDQNKGMEYMKRAAVLGDPGAMGNIGAAMIYGYGVPVDYEKGFEYLKKAEQQGNAAAYSALADCYENGYGTKKDKKLARKYKEMAADAAKELQQQMRNMR